LTAERRPREGHPNVAVALLWGCYKRSKKLAALHQAK